MLECVEKVSVISLQKEDTLIMGSPKRVAYGLQIVSMASRCLQIYIASASGNNNVRQREEKTGLKNFQQQNWHEASLTLLGQEKGKSALQGDTLARPLVIGGEARRVRRLGDLAVGDLLEGVEAVAAGVEGVHQMHGGRLDVRV